MNRDPKGKDAPEKKKTWQTLELERLDVVQNAQAGGGRLQPGEAFNFYRPS